MRYNADDVMGKLADKVAEKEKARIDEFNQMMAELNARDEERKAEFYDTLGKAVDKLEKAEAEAIRKEADKIAEEKRKAEIIANCKKRGIRTPQEEETRDSLREMTATPEWKKAIAPKDHKIC